MAWMKAYVNEHKLSMTKDKVFHLEVIGKKGHNSSFSSFLPLLRGKNNQEVVFSDSVFYIFMKFDRVA